jgi:hypothetical protein
MCRSRRDRVHARASRSRLGIETRCALSCVCDRKDVAGIESLPDQRSHRDQRAYADGNLWDHIRGVPGRTFHSFAGGRISRKHWARSDFLRPDLIFIHDRQDALKGVQVYIGDGATVTTSFIPRRGKKAHWPFAGLHPANVVRKGRRTASYHFTLRLGDCYRRRTQAIRKTPRHGRRTTYRSAYRLRWNEAGAVMVTTVS